MKPIKFRGIRKDNGQWVEGDLMYANTDHPAILENHQGTIPVAVIPETVGEWTGLKDKNGREIWEGDILATENTVNHDIDLWDREAFGYTTAYWSEANDGWLGTKWTWCKKPHYCVYELEFVEVIGNIHENPELLDQ